MTARALVAIPSAAQPAVRQALRLCEAQFAATYPDAAVELTRRHYSLIFVGLHFGESRMFDFIELVREMQPSARIVALMDPETPLSPRALLGVRTALSALKVEGFVDLTPSLTSEGDLESITRIRHECERGRQGPALKPAGPRLAQAD
jgi:hypothetical protein